MRPVKVSGYYMSTILVPRRYLVHTKLRMQWHGGSILDFHAADLGPNLLLVFCIILSDTNNTILTGRDRVGNTIYPQQSESVCHKTSKLHVVLSLC